MAGDTRVYGYLRAVEHGLTDTQHAVLAVLARGDRRVEVDPRAGRVSHRMRAELLVVEMEALDRMADEQRRFDDREWLTKLYWHSARYPPAHARLAWARRDLLGAICFWPEGRSRLGWSPPHDCVLKPLRPRLR